LRQYLTDPQGKEGQSHAVPGFANATDANDVIAYLVTLK
jgi:cytochrome c2